MPELIIPRPKEFEEKIERFRPENSLALFDFDGTVTKHEGFNSWSILCPALGHNYALDAQKMVKRFYQIEDDGGLSPEEKVQQLEALWRGHAELLTTIPLTRHHINEVLVSHIEERHGMLETITNLEQCGIPALIFSGGVSPIIELFLRIKLGHHTIPIIANEFSFCSERNFIGFKGQVIHTGNKTDRHVAELRETISDCTSFLLFGDHPRDSEMITADDSRTIVSVGFMPPWKIHERRIYEEKFDIVVVADECDGGTGNFLTKKLGI